MAGRKTVFSLFSVVAIGAMSVGAMHVHGLDAQASVFNQKSSGFESEHQSQSHSYFTEIGPDEMWGHEVIGAPVMRNGAVIGHVHDLWIGQDNKILKVIFKNVKSEARNQKQSVIAPLQMVDFKSIDPMRDNDKLRFVMASDAKVSPALVDPYSLGLWTTFRDFTGTQAQFLEQEKEVSLSDILVSYDGMTNFALVKGDAQEMKLMNTVDIVPMICGGGFVIDITQSEWVKIPNIHQDTTDLPVV